MSGILSDPEIERFKELMVVSNLRGWTGSGVIAVDRASKVRWIKNLHSGIECVKSENFTNMVKDARPSILVGHTRYPTRGNVDYASTHPHSAGHIIGVHNGTMHKIMEEKIPDGASDSKLLFEAIAEHGPEDAISKSEGAMALVWVNTQEGTLNFYRNYQRPMWMAVTAGKGTIYWASERAMLQFILKDRANHFVDIAEVKPNRHYCFDLDLPSPIVPIYEKDIFREYKTVHTYNGRSGVAQDNAPFRGVANYPGNSVARTDGQPKCESTSTTETGSTNGSGTPTDTARTASTESNTRTVIHLPDRTKKPKVIIDQYGKMHTGDDVQRLLEEVGTEDRTLAVGPAVPDWMRHHPDIDPMEDVPEITYKEVMEGHHVSIKRYMELVEKGCAYCGTVHYTGAAAAIAGAPDVNFFSKSEYLCENCATDAEIVNFCAADSIMWDLIAKQEEKRKRG